MKRELANPFIRQVIDAVSNEYGHPARSTKKVDAWHVRPGLGIVVQVDQPMKENVALMWLPYPPEGGVVPEIALEYPGEAGRHSNTYPTPGLAKGQPALKLRIRTDQELKDTLNYVKALAAATPLPEVPIEKSKPEEPLRVEPEKMPPVQPVAERRSAIPRSVQREVWQRDGGRCVECATREKLCFDHIVPFSRGGSNTVRNLQLLCESCNASKGNRI